MGPRLLAEENHETILAGVSPEKAAQLKQAEYLKPFIASRKLRILEPAATQTDLINQIQSEYLALNQTLNAEIPVMGTDTDLLTAIQKIVPTRVFSVPEMDEIKVAAYLATTNLAKFGEPYLRELQGQYNLAMKDGVLLFDETIHAILEEFFQIQQAIEATRKAA